MEEKNVKLIKKTKDDKKEEATAPSERDVRIMTTVLNFLEDNNYLRGRS